jgi:hypothetical protein
MKPPPLISVPKDEMSSMHPVLALWLKVTAVIALGIVALMLMAILTKIFIVAAVVGGLVVGALFLYSVFRRRRQLPTVR